MSKNQITNTSKKSEVALASMLAMAVGGSEMILGQEKQGQGELSRSQVLPTKGLGEKAMHYFLEHFGFKVVGYAKDHGGDEDQLFKEVVFPEGWRVVPTDHSMWSNLVDPKGRKRASIFYKAAFYDRDAHIHLCPRFCATSKLAVDTKDTWYPAVVSSDDAVMWAGALGAYGRSDEATGILAKTTFKPEEYDWDLPVEFPPSAYVAPPTKKYAFNAIYRQDGHIADRGVTTHEFTCDDAAKAWWMENHRMSGYDIECTITEGTRVVATLTVERPQTKRRAMDPFGNTLDFDHYGRIIDR